MEFGAATATLSKKLSNGSAYDGIFATPIKFTAPSFSSRLDDYCEIFGGSEASLGSSIPILEIPELDERKILDDIRRSKLDYSKVFGGFGNLDAAVPYEELFAEPKKVKSFPKKALRRAKGENQSMKEDHANYLKEDPLVSQEAAPSDDASKISMSYHKINLGSEKETIGTMHIAQLHAAPAYTCLVEEVNSRADNSTPVMPDAYLSTCCREREKESGLFTESVAGPSPDNANEHSVRSGANKCNVSERVAGADSPSYLDDIVDSNSEAAASVAALKKAIAEAQERIQVAKESMKRKKEGMPDRLNRRSECNLKTELKKEAKVLDKTIGLEETDMWRPLADVDALPKVLSEIRKPMNRAEQVIPDQRGKETFVAKEAVNETQQKSKSTQHKEERVKVECKKDDKSTVIQYKQADNDKKALNDNQWNEINRSGIGSEKLENFGQTIEVVDGAGDQNEENINSSNELYGSKEFVNETKLAQETLDHGVKDGRLKAYQDAVETVKEVASFHELADHEGELGEQEVTIGEEKKFVCKQEEAEGHQEHVEVEKEVAQDYNATEEKVEVSCVLEECGLRELLQPIDNEEELNPQGLDLKSKDRQVENWEYLEDGKKRNEAGLMDMYQESEHSCGREGSDNEFENIQVEEIMEEIFYHIHDEEEIQKNIRENGESDGKGRRQDAKENEKELEVPIYLMEENETGWKNNSKWVEVIGVTQSDPHCEERQTKEADETTETTSPIHEQDETEDLSKIQVADTGVQNNETREVTPDEYAHNDQDDIMVASNTSFEAEEKCKEPEAVEETDDCGKKNILETQGSFELNEAMIQMQNIKETVMFDSASTEVDEADIKVMQNQDECSQEAENDCNLAMLVEELTPESVEISKEAKEAEVVLNEEIDKNQCDSSYEEKLVDTEQNVGASQLHYMSEWESNTFKNQESKTSDSNLKENHQATLGVEEKKANGTSQKVELEKKQMEKIDETKEREREREREKLAVERAIREARERAFAEACKRAVMERAAAEARRKNLSDGRERLGKPTGQPNEKILAEKAAMEAKLKAERAAVERATAEARARALERALSEKAVFEARCKSENFVAEKSFGASRDNATRHRFYSKSFNNGDADEVPKYTDVFDGANGDSAQRCKARSERYQRIGERVAKALAEKNMRDRLVQKEQEERNRVAEALDADVKRWSSGKEGNLRALLSTLQYILGPDSGWQPIPLTDIVTNPAVKKAYRKATLFVHPDKLQQRGASIQQKHTCEKVFDLLKEAWNRFNIEER